MVINRNEELQIFAIKKIKSIGCAMLMTYTLYVLTGWIIDVFWLKNETIISFYYSRGLNNWFLITMCISVIAVKAVNVYGRNSIFTIAIAYGLFCLMNQGETNIPMVYIEQSLLAYVFIFLGSILGQRILKLLRKYKKYLLGCVIGLFFVVNSVAQYNGPCAMAANIYGKSKILFTITSVLGIMGILCFATSGINSKFVKFCGRNSMIMFVTHFSTLKIITNVWSKTMKWQYTEWPYYIIIFGLLLVIESAITCFITRKMVF